MISNLKKGDKVAIVSLSSGILGEDFVAHEKELGIKRLKEMGLEPVFMPNSLKGTDYIKNHPEARADDLKEAFSNREIKMILSSIGGEDTYKTIPYLLNDDFKNLVQQNPKIFMGFSDTTTNHLMFQKLGLNTFYGPAFLPDFGELEPNMLPYTKQSLNVLFEPQKEYEIYPSPIWYDDRTDFSANAVGTLKIRHNEEKGFELLNGTKIAVGKLLGGCLDVLASLVGIEEDSKQNRYDNSILKNYNVFPSLEEWKNKIMFIETSESKMKPEYYKKIIKTFKLMGIFNQINGLIVGKPIDEAFYNEYKQILIDELSEYQFPILYNLNFGHSTPRTIIPYGANAEIDPISKTFKILEFTIENH